MLNSTTLVTVVCIVQTYIVIIM